MCTGGHPLSEGYNIVRVAKGARSGSSLSVGLGGLRGFAGDKLVLSPGQRPVDQSRSSLGLAGGSLSRTLMHRGPWEQGRTSAAAEWPGTDSDSSFLHGQFWHDFVSVPFWA